MTATEPVLDVAALRRELDGEHHEVRQHVREGFAREELGRGRADGLGREDYRALVLEWTRLLAEEGETARGFPAAQGGGADTGGAVASFETLAYGDLSLVVKVGVQFGLFGGAIQQLGTRRHHERYLADVMSLRLIGCFAMTEHSHGSDVQNLRTTATYDPDGDEFVVDTPDDDASKEWIGNAARDGRMAAVFAQLVVDGEEHGVHCLLVPLRDEGGEALPGVRIEDCGPKIGLEGVDNGRIWFDGVRVPREALLDRFGTVNDRGRYSSSIESAGRRFFTTLGTLIQGRVSVGGASVSAAKAALTIAVRHGLRRRQFSAPDADEEILVMDYLAHQRRLLPRLATTYALTFAQEENVAMLVRSLGGEADEDEQREIESRAAGLKAVASWHCVETVQACRECCGGLGYRRDAGFAALREDTDVFTTFEGDNTVLLQLVGKELLTGFESDFGALDPLETVGFVASQVLETVRQRTGSRTIRGAVEDLFPGDDEGQVRNRDAQLDLLREREEHQVSSLARRMKGGIDQGADPFDVFSRCQDHLLSAARSHVDRIVLEAFARRVEACKDPATREHLDRLCHLHALSQIERDRAWFLEHGQLSVGRSKAVTRAVNELCGEVREHAAGLVDAFGIPDAALHSSLGATEPAAHVR